MVKLKKTIFFLDNGSDRNSFYRTIQDRQQLQLPLSPRNTIQGIHVVGKVLRIACCQSFFLTGSGSLKLLWSNGHSAIFFITNIQALFKSHQRFKVNQSDWFLIFWNLPFHVFRTKNKSNHHFCAKKKIIFVLAIYDLKFYEIRSILMSLNVFFIVKIIKLT